MYYQDLYRQCLNSLSDKIRMCNDLGKRTCLGYTSDLDVLIRWDLFAFNEMVEKHLRDQVPSFQPTDVLHDASDFVRVVCYLMINGIGGEIDICSHDLCEELAANFEWEYSLGGTSAQGSAALASVGIPVLMQISDRSENVCRYLNYPEISMISAAGNIVPVMEMVSGLEPVRHFILQYDKGDIIKIGREQYTVPISNRLIMDDHDEMHKMLPVDPAALTYLENHALDIASYNISGFNSIVAPEILQHTIQTMSAHYRQVKKTNPNCVLYLESAHYLNPQSRETVYKGFAPYLDILGMNEEEISDLAGAHGWEFSLNDPPSLVSTLEMIHESYPARGLVVHTKDFAMYYGWPNHLFDMEKALCWGNLLSGTRARVGHYGDAEDCEGTLLLPLSQVGIALTKAIPKEHKGRLIYIVPSRYMENPRTTIGLGDTFAAGMQIAFI